MAVGWLGFRGTIFVGPEGLSMLVVLQLRLPADDPET